MSDQPEDSHQPSDCGDADACAALEDGLYRSEQDQASGWQVIVSLHQPDTFEVSLEGMIKPFALAVQGVSPPELVRSWQFRMRTAAAVRAPSLV